MLLDVLTWAALLQHVEKLEKFLQSNMNHQALVMLIAVDTHAHCRLRS